MNRQHHKPAWFVLYVLFALMLGVLALITQDGLPAWANEIAIIVVILFLFGILAFWAKINMSALLEEEERATGLDELRIQLVRSPRLSNRNVESRDSDPFRVDSF